MAAQYDLNPPMMEFIIDVEINSNVCVPKLTSILYLYNESQLDSMRTVDIPNIVYCINPKLNATVTSIIKYSFVILRLQFSVIN